MKDTTPKFLSGKPLGEDKFTGGSQNKIAKIIAKTIIEDSSDRKVIGLEGEWGSGKSNVVKILEKELGDNYYTFIFDAWGYQEDLTRRTFLEQLIFELFKNGNLKDSSKWQKNERELLGKTSKSYVQKFPKIKSFWIVISSAIILLGFLSSLYSNVFIDWDINGNINLGKWKPVFFIYALPLVLFVIGLNLVWVEYKKIKVLNQKLDLKDQESNMDIIGKILYWFSGKEIESEEIKNILEKEPSVKKFREYFLEIEKDIKDKKLLVVFDNLDRLEPAKIKTLWSSIHTFFAESKVPFKSWVIIPYERTILTENLSDGFIEKTFSINFRVTPPVVIAWESFLLEKIR